MSKIQYELPYEDRVFIIGPKGEQLDVGTVLEKREDQENKCIHCVVELRPEIPEELRKAIEAEPRLLKFVRLPKQAKGILILP